MLPINYCESWLQAGSQVYDAQVSAALAGLTAEQVAASVIAYDNLGYQYVINYKTMQKM